MKFVPSVERSILKPSSLVEPSVHARLIALLLMPDVVKLLGETGGVGGVPPLIIVK